jgi:two-component system KDP operon response regulator KdpE
MSCILVVDDDPRMIATLEVSLRARGLDMVLARCGEDAQQAVARHQPDAVVLDFGVARMDGLDVVRGLRGCTTVPIIVLSDRGSEAAKVEALDLGADDYLMKPFGLDELFARLRVALRRAAVPAAEPLVTTPDFTIDFAARQVRRDGELVRLTPTQWRIVEVLVRNAGRLVTYEQLLHEVWGPAYGNETNYLRVFMTQIRHKLEPDRAKPRYLITEPGIGYRFDNVDSAGSGDDG